MSSSNGRQRLVVLKRHSLLLFSWVSAYKDILETQMKSPLNLVKSLKNDLKEPLFREATGLI